MQQLHDGSGRDRTVETFLLDRRTDEKSSIIFPCEIDSRGSDKMVKLGERLTLECDDLALDWSKAKFIETGDTRSNSTRSDCNGCGRNALTANRDASGVKTVDASV